MLSQRSDSRQLCGGVGVGRGVGLQRSVDGLTVRCFPRVLSLTQEWSVVEEERWLSSGWVMAFSKVLGQSVAHRRRKLEERGGVEGRAVNGSGWVGFKVY